MESPDSLGKRGEPGVRAAERLAAFGSDVAQGREKTQGKRTANTILSWRMLALRKMLDSIWRLCMEFVRPQALA